MPIWKNRAENQQSILGISCIICHLAIVNRLTLNVIFNSKSLHINRIYWRIYNETFTDFLILKSDNNFRLSRVGRTWFVIKITVPKLSNLLWLNFKDKCLINIHLQFCTFHALYSLDLSYNQINDMPQLSGISVIIWISTYPTMSSPI